MALTALEAGERLAQYLKRSKMQQKDLAAALSVEPSYISRMVKGHINWTTGSYFGAIASQLDLADHEIKELNQAAVVEYRADERERLPEIDATVTPEIPAELIEAGEMYKAIDPRLSDPAVQRDLARAGNFGAGPRTPQEWIRYFNDVSHWLGNNRN